MDDPFSPNDLVSIDTGGPLIDAIVFDVPSHNKVVVAVVDPTKGPVFRTVSPDDLRERAEEGPQDKAMLLLMRRTPPPEHGKARGAKGGGHGRAGYSRATSHRKVGES